MLSRAARLLIRLLPLVAILCLLTIASSAQNRIDYASQVKNKPVIDVHNIAGVDCTGVTDSSVALNALTVIDGITRKTLSFRNCTSIRLNSQWLIKGQNFAEIDFGGTFGQGNDPSSNPAAPQGGVTIFGCSGVADAVIHIDDTGFSYFHGGTIEAKGGGCTSSFTGSIRISNSGTGGYTPSRNTFSHMSLYSNIGGQQITNYVGFNIDNGPNQEGYGFHHVQVFCQNSPSSVGILINDLTADSTDIDEESHVTTCYQGIKIGTLGGIARVSNSHIGGNGSFTTFGAGGANFFESANGCFVDIHNVISAETSGAFFTGPIAGGKICRRTFWNNQIGFPNIDPAVYPIIATGDSFTLFNNDFGNGGIAVAIHNNTIIGNDANGTAGPTASVYDLGGNQLTDTANVGAFLLTLQPFQKIETFLGPTSPVANGAVPSAGTSSDWALLPIGAPGAGGAEFPSSRLIFSRSLLPASTPVLDQFAFRNVGDSNDAVTTLALTYKAATGSAATGTLGFQPPVSGMTLSQVAVPAFDPIHSNVTNVGTPGSTTYSYVIVARGGCGTSAASATGTTTTGNATLSSTNYNTINMKATAGAWGIDVYRTVGGATSGKIGTALVTDIGGGGVMYLGFNDTGLTGDGTTAPTVNGSGCMKLPTSLTVASLPTCNAAAEGTWLAVSDATAPTYNATLTGGGAIHIPVYCNGNAWTAH